MVAFQDKNSVETDTGCFFRVFAKHYCKKNKNKKLSLLVYIEPSKHKSRQTCKLFKLGFFLNNRTVLLIRPPLYTTYPAGGTFSSPGTN